MSDLLTNVAGGFAVTLVRNETQEHSAALKSAGQSPIGLLPLFCRGDNPVDSSLVVDFSQLAAESYRVISRSRLGQILGQIRELFRNREPAVSFLSRGQKRQGFEVRNRSKGMPKRLFSLFGACLAK